jgi:hypothetical protein
MKKQTKFEIISSILVFLTFFLFLIEQIQAKSMSRVTFIIILLGFLLLFAQKRLPLSTLLIILILVIQMSLSVFLLGSTNVLRILKSVQFILIAVLLVGFKLNYQIILFSFSLHVGFFAYQMFIGSNPNLIFAASRNMVSVIMLIQTSLLYLTLIGNNRRITFIPALINLYMCLWAVGRSGIVSSLILLFGVSYVILKQDDKWKKSLGVLIFGLIIIFVFYSFQTVVSSSGSFLKTIVVARDNFLSRGLESSGRVSIINEYIRSATSNIRYFIFGVPSTSSEIFIDFNSNFHNSYLRLHSNYGLLGFLLIMIMILVALINLIREKSILHVALLLALLVRISTDTIAFVGITDPLLFYFILPKNSDNVSKVKANAIQVPYSPLKRRRA